MLNLMCLDKRFIKKKPTTAPTVFNMRSSISNTPNPEINCKISKNKLMQNAVITKMEIFLQVLNRAGNRNPMGIKPNRFPRLLLIWYSNLSGVFMIWKMVLKGTKLALNHPSFHS